MHLNILSRLRTIRREQVGAESPGLHVQIGAKCGRHPIRVQLLAEVASLGERLEGDAARRHNGGQIVVRPGRNALLVQIERFHQIGVQSSALGNQYRWLSQVSKICMEIVTLDYPKF